MELPVAGMMAGYASSAPWPGNPRKATWATFESVGLPSSPFLLHAALPELSSPQFQSRSKERKRLTFEPGKKKTGLIRYTLDHPRTPRTLRFGTMRMLRHWTIHRAWRLYQHAQWRTRELELERQYNKIRAACEELRKTSPGLYRRAMAKSTFRYPTVEMRIPTDTPPKGGWNHEWRRA